MEGDVGSHRVRRDDLGFEELRSVLREVLSAPGTLLDLGDGFPNDFSHLERHRRRVLVPTLPQDFGEMGEEHGAILRVHFPPRPEGLAGPIDFLADLSRGGDRVAR